MKCKLLKVTLFNFEVVMKSLGTYFYYHKDMQPNKWM